MSSSFLQVLRPPLSASNLLLVSSGIITATFVAHKRSLLEGSSTDDTKQSVEVIETDFMDQIAQKPYLQAFTSQDQRPFGVPHRLRLLAIDVPEMRTVFDGNCLMNLSKVYVDDVAPRKAILVGSQEYQVPQKSLAKSLIKCRKRKKIGVELLEASVANLNPKNMRKTHEFGVNLRYDPGKYTKRLTKLPNNVKPKVDELSSTSGKESEENKISNAEKESSPSLADGHVKDNSEDDADSISVLATEDDEVHAPWHQYAWTQELELRVRHFKNVLSPSLNLSITLFVYIHGYSLDPREGSLWKYSESILIIISFRKWRRVQNYSSVPSKFLGMDVAFLPTS
jgi:hypothetical protein